MEAIWNAENQRLRREKLYAAHRELLGKIVSPDGRFLIEELEGKKVDHSGGGDPRVALWHTFPAFAGEAADIKLGNAILRQTSFSPEYDFGMCALIQLWLRYQGKFEPDLREKALAAISAAGEPQSEFPGFVGMNDNFPAMEVLVQLFAGELTSRDALVAGAVAKLRSLLGRLETHGTIAEFNSPTYTFITMCCMADIVEHAKNEEARAIALRIENQLWLDMCGRLHPASSQMGGPSSRSYMADSCGHMHNGRFPMETVFGSEIFFSSPMRYSYKDWRGMVLHHGDNSFIPANGCWLAAANYHVPDQAGPLVTERKYPFEAIGTAACAFLWRPDEWRYTADGREAKRMRKFETFRYAPALLTTYDSGDFSLSTSAGAHACGDGAQHDAFFLSYRRRRPTENEQLSLADVRTAFCRYVFNGQEPSSSMSLLSDEGRKTSVQKGGTALMLYRPGTDTLSNITSMRLSVILPTHFNKPDEVWLDDEKLAGFAGERQEPKTVFVRDGIIAIAYRPLELTDYGRPAAVRVSQMENFLTINFFNYEGPARKLNFSHMGALYTQNGFVVEVEAVENDDAFAAFRTRVLKAGLADAIEGGLRKVIYQREGLDLRLAYAPSDDSAISYATINGKPRQIHRFRAGKPE